MNIISSKVSKFPSLCSSTGRYDRNTLNIDSLPSKKISGIYCIRNLNNAREYYGSSTGIARRLRTHIKELQNNEHSIADLQTDFNNKHRFDYTIVEVYASEERNDLYRVEQKYLNKASLNPAHYYNRTFICHPSFKLSETMIDWEIAKKIDWLKSRCIEINPNIADINVAITYKPAYDYSI